MVKENPIFAHSDEITPAKWESLPEGTPETLSQVPFKTAVDNFYQVDPITRHSKTMAECSAEVASIAEQRGRAANG